MQIKVNNKYGEEDVYNCEGKNCEKCGLRFVCYTERGVVKLDWKSFCVVLKGRNKLSLLYEGCKR